MTGLAMTGLRAQVRRGAGPRLALHATLLAAAVCLWIVALAGTDIASMRGLGLIDAFPSAYYGAVLLVVWGATAALLGARMMPRVFFVHLGALIVFLHGTTPLLYSEPRYPWVYKHLGIIDFIESHGGVDRSLDIYNNWPGFFALNSLLDGATGMDAADYAAWAQVFFSVLTVAATLFAIRPLVSDPRQRLLAALLVVVGDWVAQNYLAPQALALPLVIVVLGLLLRLAPRADEGSRIARLLAPARRPGAAMARRTVRADATPDPDPVPVLDARVVMALALLPAVAVVLIHQLSPFVMIVAMLLLAAFTGRRLWKILVMVGIVQLVWIALAWPYLADRISIFEFGGVPNAAPTATAPPLPRADLTAVSSRLVVFVMVLLAIAGIVRRLRRGRDVAAPVLLVAAPLLLVPLQSYGGEAGLRAYLFALPWLAVLASDALIGLADRGRAAAGAASARGRVMAIACVGTVASLVAALTLVAYFGGELGNYVGPEDVHASEWFEQNAPDGAVLAFLSPGFPNRISGRYADLAVTASSFSPALTDDPYTRPRLLDASTRLEAIRGLMNVLPQRDRFLAIGPTQERINDLFGILPHAVSRAVLADLRAAPDFPVVYDRDGTVIFGYDPEGS